MALYEDQPGVPKDPTKAFLWYLHGTLVLLGSGEWVAKKIEQLALADGADHRAEIQRLNDERFKAVESQDFETAASMREQEEKLKMEMAPILASDVDELMRINMRLIDNVKSRLAGLHTYKVTVFEPGDAGMS
jgi:hypothetical protein